MVKHIWCLYYLCGGHTLNILDVIRLKRAYLIRNELTVSQSHENIIVFSRICRVNNIVFSDAFWIPNPNEFYHFSRFSECFVWKFVKLIGVVITNRRISFIMLEICGFCLYWPGFESAGAISFHISLYVRNCSRNDTVLRAVFMFSGLCVLPINF